MSRGLIYALGVLSGGLGIAILFELLGMLDEQAPSISASVRRLGATGAAINPEAQDTVNECSRRGAERFLADLDRHVQGEQPGAVGVEARSDRPGQFHRSK